MAILNCNQLNSFVYFKKLFSLNCIRNSVLLAQSQLRKRVVFIKFKKILTSTQLNTNTSALSWVYFKNNNAEMTRLSLLENIRFKKHKAGNDIVKYLFHIIERAHGKTSRMEKLYIFRLEQNVVSDS